jgi:hypothetical protein
MRAYFAEDLVPRPTDATPKKAPERCDSPVPKPVLSREPPTQTHSLPCRQLFHKMLLETALRPLRPPHASAAASAFADSIRHVRTHENVPLRIPCCSGRLRPRAVTERGPAGLPVPVDAARFSCMKIASAPTISLTAECLVDDEGPVVGACGSGERRSDLEAATARRAAAGSGGRCRIRAAICD